MRLQTLSSTETAPAVPEHISVKRGDPVYGAHSYLTKVPVTAIAPFIEAFTKPGDLVLDCFAGSGMTGVAAAMTGRRGVLRDINVLGRHIGMNYVNLVDAEALRAAVDRVLAVGSERVGDVYGVTCAECGQRGELSRTTWSIVSECKACGTALDFYRELERADWSKSRMRCPSCATPFSLRGAPRCGEEPVLDTILCACRGKLQDQPPTEPLEQPRLDGLSWPELEITADRQMFQASALGKHNLRTTSSFFSTRNLAALGALREAIASEEDRDLRSKLLFVFTAILARASKRYQWSRKRPLNAAHQHYYVAPVFYEWNVFDLFARKAASIIRSDDFLRDALSRHAFLEGAPMTIDVDYRVGSADSLDLADGSVDYVFTDPPFGSNIFYSDMSLFQEAWLGETTDHTREAVVDRSGNGETRRTAERYEVLIGDALGECARVLKPEGWLSLVFSNSSGAMWALVQRAIARSGFVVDPERIAVLDKGQRSVKGLASGFENVVTADLILSMRKARAGATVDPPRAAPADFLNLAVDAAIATKERDTPTHVYLGVVKQYLRSGYDVSEIDMARVATHLSELGYEVEPATGLLHRAA